MWIKVEKDDELFGYYEYRYPNNGNALDTVVEAEIRLKKLDGEITEWETLPYDEMFFDKFAREKLMKFNQ
ncbi:hypothetical protein IGK30_003215 [Enterococcus sp. AZ178]|uniref:hypothetical protein n=1 Tax=Enterococcus sp. AZ178 TaxID=2774822 RepID=UPI003F1E9C79